MEDSIIPESITRLVQERIAAKNSKDYILADKIRKEIESQ